MAAHRFVAVVGARVLPEQVASQVADVVGFFLSRGWGIGSGGPRGAGGVLRLRAAQGRAGGGHRREGAGGVGERGGGGVR